VLGHLHRSSDTPCFVDTDGCYCVAVSAAVTFRLGDSSM
jgi:hypothetical protein